MSDNMLQINGSVQCERKFTKADKGKEFVLVTKVRLVEIADRITASTGDRVTFKFSQKEAAFLDGTEAENYGTLLEDKRRVREDGVNEGQEQFAGTKPTQKHPGAGKDSRDQ